MTRRPTLFLLLLLLLAVTGCGRRAADRPLEVSAIGVPAAIVDPSRGPPDAPAAALLGATAQGLVAFDQSGQIEPALADRWIVSDRGRSFIFRVDDRRWADGRPVDAREVARALRAMVAPRSRNPLKPLLGAIRDIAAVTPEVIEIDLGSPRPNLLQLLAQPEAALLRGSLGSGPMRATLAGGVTTLRPIPAPDAADPPPPSGAIHLHGERAARAVTRFMAGRADVVLGGTFADLAIARAAALPGQQPRLDPVHGLFGFAFTALGTGGPTADRSVRAALAMAVDRDRIAATFAAPGWTPQTALVPAGTTELRAPAEPGWAADTLAGRRDEARAAVAAWAAAHGPPPVLRVALPAGPGARMLMALVARDWAAIGITAVPVPADAPAELRLVDRVAPSDSSSFYLRRFACAEDVPCTPDAEAALDAARSAPTLAARAALLAQADRALLGVTPFIAIAQPLRWSLVGRAAAGWRDSPRGIHPLATLRTPSS